MAEDEFAHFGLYGALSHMKVKASHAVDKL
jgi:hypothetical protein